MYFFIHSVAATLKSYYSPHYPTFYLKVVFWFIRAVLAGLEKLISQARSSRKALSAHEVLANRQLSTARITIYAQAFLALKTTLLTSNSDL